MSKKYDFGGWATKNDLKCSDGRIIQRGAFKHNDGATVPLVWNHQHNEPYNVLGHAALEDRPEGVYAYCTFNGTDHGQNAKELVRHGDISALSIYANKLKEVGRNVVHGTIREVSLVLSGANPGAFIDSILEHSEGEDGEAVVYTGEVLDLYHSEDEPEDVKMEEEITHADEDSEETLQDVFDTLTDKQKNVVYAIMGQLVEGESAQESNEEIKQSDEEGPTTMKKNVFDKEGTVLEHSLTHAEIESVFANAKRIGSLRESFRESVIEHGITDIEYLFPEAKLLNTPPELIQREMSWVRSVMGGVHKTPFSRIKSMFADLREDEARAKGYLKGNKKPEEVFGLLKRTTAPYTVVKLQKLDRDDVIDITDFDVVAWIKSEMRMMLEEEIARAILVGDGRPNSSNDKINPLNIRPIWGDEDLYTISVSVPAPTGSSEEERALSMGKAFIRAAVKSRKDYTGSGNPTLYTTEDILTDMLLMEDAIGHRLYDSVEKLATAMRVNNIITVPVMENLTRTRADSATVKLLGLIVNLRDYNIGADKGGAVAMFEDFDIDYNKQTYMIETRCSGALIKPYSAIAIEMPVT